jgi:hypothetical protein
LSYFSPVIFLAFWLSLYFHTSSVFTPIFITLNQKK